MNNFILGTVQIEEFLKDLGLETQDVSLPIFPILKEHRSKLSGCWNDEVWNVQAFNELQSLLISKGFKVDPNPMKSSLNYMMNHLKMPGSNFRIYVKVELPKENEIAQLKARLAVLEGN